MCQHRYCNTISCNKSVKNVGLGMGLGSILAMTVRCQFLDTVIDGSDRLHQHPVSLSKALSPHCFNRLSCGMITRRGDPLEGCSVL